MSHLRLPKILLNHLIRPQEQRLRNGEPERPGGLEFDDQLDLGRLLDRKVIAGQTFRIAHRNGLSQNAQVGVRHIPDRQEGSLQAEVPALLVAPADVHVTTKKSLDSFLHTDLDFLLRQVYDAETVVLAGVNTD